MTDDEFITGAIPFADQLSADSMNALRSKARRLSLPPRTVLLQPGDAVSGAYFVRCGSIRIYYLDAAGEEGTLYRIDAGSSCILALNCLFSRVEYPAWAEAGDEGVDLLSIDGTLARSMILADPRFTELLFEQISGRLFAILTTLEAAIRLPLEGRLIGFLLEAADDQGTVALSQERIADHLGTSREVISRALRRLAKRNLLKSSYGRIEVLDLAGLRVALRQA